MKNMRRIKVKQTNYKGLGAFATERVLEGQIIFSVPEDEFIIFELVYDLYQFHELLYNMSVTPKSIFAYFLASISILQCSQDHQYNYVSQYISQLPTEIHGLILWQQHQLNEIKDQLLVNKIAKKKCELQNQFQTIKKQVQKIWSNPCQIGEYRVFAKKQEIEKVVFCLFLKFYSVIESRAVYHQSRDQLHYEIGALIPIIDKLNHSQTPNCKVELGAFYTVKAITNIQQNQQITVSYGKYKIQHFLQYYGFVPNQNHEKYAKIDNKGQYRKRMAKQYNKQLDNMILQDK